jgi:hypothetical protein
MVVFFVYDIPIGQLRNVIDYFRNHLPHPIVSLQETFDGEHWTLSIEVRKELTMADVEDLQLSFEPYAIACIPGEDDDIPDEYLQDVCVPLTNDEFENIYNRINVSVYTQLNNNYQE